MLGAYDIDFKTRAADGPAVMLQWNGKTFTDIFGGTDFLAMAGRAGCRRSGRRVAPGPTRPRRARAPLE